MTVTDVNRNTEPCYINAGTHCDIELRIEEGTLLLCLPRNQKIRFQDVAESLSTGGTRSLAHILVEDDPQ